jgi:hypothetical protein
MHLERCALYVERCMLHVAPCFIEWRCGVWCALMKGIARCALCDGAALYAMCGDVTAASDCLRLLDVCCVMLQHAELSCTTPCRAVVQHGP